MAEPPKYGYFVEGSIVGVLLDTDRGCINFFKDGNDLGPAYIMDELKEGEFYPLLRTQIKCKIQIFSDKLHPWINDIPEEPIQPTEVTRDEEFLYTEIAAEERRQMEM